MTNYFNPYFIEAPALISFSGGRTSGYMLKQIIDTYDGQLPADIIPCFANTGKEIQRKRSAEPSLARVVAWLLDRI